MLNQVKANIFFVAQQLGRVTRVYVHNGIREERSGSFCNLHWFRFECALKVWTP